MTYQIYRILRAGRISGDEIGKKLGISRAAVNKHIMKLRAEGINIISASGVGYEWSNENIINQYALQYELEKLKINIPVICKETESTNRNAKGYAIDNKDDLLVVAPYQTAGRGRLTRTFESNIGGAYFTLAVSASELPIATIMRIVLLAGLGVSDMLGYYGIKSSLKWPNDVYVDNKKICGILLELITSGETADKLIIGIGININNELSEELRNIATRMKDKVNKYLDIAEIIAMVVDRIYYYIDILKKGNWNELCNKYLEVSYNIGKIVECNGVKGIAKGITNEGFLIIDVNGKDNRIITGDVNIC